MKIDHFLLAGFLELALVAGVYAQPADTNLIASLVPAVPTNTSLALSNVIGDLRVLDVNGLDLSRCVLLSTQLAKYGINVASAPPFSTIPALSLRTEVNAGRAAN